MRELLHGHGNTKGIVSIRASKSGKVTLWCRRENQVVKLEKYYKPFLLTSNVDLVKDLPYCSVINLDGNLDYKYKVEISNYQLFESELINRYQMLYESAIEKIHEMEDVKAFNASEQYLIQSGNTYFKGLNFNDLLRMQIDIETTGLSDIDKIFMIAIKASNGFEKVIHGDDEVLLLNQLNYIIQKIDPDIIENHNIFGFDLPFLYRRYNHHGIKFFLGREGDEPFIYEDSLKHGGSTIPFNRYCVTGREVIDTLHSAMRYEGMTRKLGGSFKLKHVAKVLKVNREGEENYIDGSEIYNTYKRDPDRVVDYALYDVREVDGLVVKLNQDKFFLAQMIPMQYEKICTVGSSKIIELPMVRSYLRQNHSIPKPQNISVERRKELYKGGYCEVFETGLFKNVTKLDVKSMYPSIILANGIGPHSDPLNIFQPFLKSITEKRLYYKEISEFDDSFGPIQNALKIVINSSYGYLGYSYGLFNNIFGAMEVTKEGQQIVQLMIEVINSNGGESIEADTDGVICKLPKHLGPGDFCSIIQEGLKDYPYIEIEPEPKHKPIPSLFMYKKKNYAFLHEGKIQVYGSALKSKAKPPILKEFINKSLELILNSKKEEIIELYNELASKIKNREIDIEEIAKKISLGKSVRDYLETSSKKLPHFEVWIAAGELDKKKGTTTEHYRCEGNERYKLSRDYNNDYDIKYYLKSLDNVKMFFEE